MTIAAFIAKKRRKKRLRRKAYHRFIKKHHADLANALMKPMFYIFGHKRTPLEYLVR